MFSSNIIPKNFIAVFLSILLSAFFKTGNLKDRLSLGDFSSKRVHLVFLLFKA